ncbi:flagellar biosynthetic protein FliQ [Stieleria varia]|uniref:Flagellar biosynthetic protein FliQ n=1 Tax=Stieleria varia TaxID=2528005 RepID=A0A5C6ARI8_9BACT|nr:flagellar biosynthetic protein FliQ [Stieleria varia]TWU02178.1 Flagellar biosynthetic protein FliQ [Stieleria varia]
MELVDVVALGQDFFLMALLLCAPVVGVSLVIGLVVSIGQTVTSVQEQTLSFAPRIVAVAFVMMLMANWYLTTLQNYTLNVFANMIEFLR